MLSLINCGKIELLTTQPMRDEILSVVAGHARKAGLMWRKSEPAAAKVRKLLDKAKLITVSPVFDGCEDPDDNMFFDCAIEGKADCIVAEDHHLSGVEHPPVPVLSPWQFLNRYKF